MVTRGGRGEPRRATPAGGAGLRATHRATGCEPEAVGIDLDRPEVLPGARVDVADDLAPGRVQRRHGVGRRVEHIDLVERRVERLVERAAELDLPAGEEG